MFLDWLNDRQTPLNQVHPVSLIPETAIPENMQVVHLIAARLDTLHGDMQELKGVQREMAAAFSKLILIEERQANTTAAQERQMKALEKLETKLEAYTIANREVAQQLERRVDTLEVEAPMLKQTSTWVIAGVIGFVALVAPKLIERLF